MVHRFVMISRWRLDSTAAAVWQLLTDIDAWPGWWRYVRSAKRVERGAASPLGDVAELHWGSALPYGIRLRVTTLAADAPHRLHGLARGDVSGLGTWILEPAGEQAVDVTYRWEVALERPWMRRLSFLLWPVFEWNHFVVMRAGARGMAARLGCRLTHAREWAGAHRG